VWEYPVTADVDNDGSAEIIVASNDFSTTTPDGITVFGHSDSGWAKSGPNWPTHDYAVTNILADGSVPTAAEPSWLQHNLFRARPTVDQPGASDLIPVIADVCVASCVHGPIKVSWSVQNAGSIEVEPGTEVVLYSIGNDESLTELARATLPALPAGTQLEGDEFHVNPSDWKEGVALIVDRTDGSFAGRVDECDEHNNVTELRERYCD